MQDYLRFSFELSNTCRFKDLLIGCSRYKDVGLLVDVACKELSIPYKQHGYECLLGLYMSLSI